MSQISYGTITISDLNDITEVRNWYLATSASSGVDTSTSGWATSIQTMDEVNQYLWNYEEVIAGDVVVSSTQPVIIGRYGSNGKGISGITEYYCISNSTTAPADSSFSTEVQNVSADNPYLWNYEKITYTDGNSDLTDKRIIGVYGAKGDDGVVYYIESSAQALLQNQPTQSELVDSSGNNIIDSSGNLIVVQGSSFLPSSITFYAKMRSGINSPIDYAGRFIISESFGDDSWIDKYTSSKNESSHEYAPSSDSVRFIRCTLFEAGGTTASLATQTIVVIVDGKDGSTAEWFYGTALTHTSGTANATVSGAVVGSMYLNTDTSLVYKCTAISGNTMTWTYAGDLLTGVWENIQDELDTFVTKDVAIVKSVPCYYRSTTSLSTLNSIKPTSSTTIGTSQTASNAWEYVMPQPSKNTYFYTCEEYTYADGDVGYSDVREIANATYTSKWVSDADNVYIDGGALYANSVTTSQLNTNNINTSGVLTVGALDQSANTAINNGVTAYNRATAIRGVCSTGATTAAKVVTATGFTLEQGATIVVYNTTAQTLANAITLNVNGTGAKNVYVGGAVTSASNQLLWAANSSVAFIYDGAQFRVQDNPGSWVPNSGTQCEILAETPAKTITINEIVVFKGVSVTVPMKNENTASAPTLNVTSLGAKAIYSGNTTLQPTTANGRGWIADTTVTFTFDGQYWHTGGQTIIDGDNIMTGSISAEKLNASNINASKILTVGAMTDTTASTILNSELSDDITNAGATATKYITYIDSNKGIRVYDGRSSNQNVNFAQINSNGMQVYKGGTANTNQVASFGETSIIGRVAQNEKHVEIDRDSLTLYNYDVPQAIIGGDTAFAVGADLTRIFNIQMSFACEYYVSRNQGVSIDTRASNSDTIDGFTFMWYVLYNPTSDPNYNELACRGTYTIDLENMGAFEPIFTISDGSIQPGSNATITRDNIDDGDWDWSNLVYFGIGSDSGSNILMDQLEEFFYNTYDAEIDYNSNVDIEFALPHSGNDEEQFYYEWNLKGAIFTSHNVFNIDWNGTISSYSNDGATKLMQIGRNSSYSTVESRFNISSLCNQSKLLTLNKYSASSVVSIHVIYWYYYNAAGAKSSQGNFTLTSTSTSWSSYPFSASYEISDGQIILTVSNAEEDTTIEMTGVCIYQTSDTEASSMFLGAYPDTGKNKLFMVGNGSSDSDLSNSFSVGYDGDVTISGNTPKIRMEQVTEGSEFGYDIIKGYPGNIYGMNLIVGGAGNMFIGSGESPENTYRNLNDLGVDSTYEHLFLTADNDIHIVANADTWSNRVKYDINSSGMYFPSGKTIYGYYDTGDPTFGEIAYQALQPCNENGNTVLGYGNYSNGEGNTNIYGNNINLISNNGTNVTFGKNNVLWSGAWYMSASHTATLSQNVSTQASGIVLCWSAYADSEAKDYDWFYQFIPKRHVSAHGGTGVGITMSTVGFGKVGSKYVYVYNNKIVGHASNTGTGTASGITYTNSYWVLRYVIGV